MTGLKAFQFHFIFAVFDEIDEVCVWFFSPRKFRIGNLCSFLGNYFTLLEIKDALSSNLKKKRYSAEGL